MNDSEKAAWLNVAEAAKWIAEGREIQARDPQTSAPVWFNCGAGFYAKWLRPCYEYRLKPEPPKPREWDAYVFPAGHLNTYEPLTKEAADRFVHAQKIRVREILPETGE
jgi:hypothetical protein